MRRTTILLLVAVMTLAGTAYAQGRGFGPGCGFGPCMWFQGEERPSIQPQTLEKLSKERAALMEQTLELRTELFKKSERFKTLMGDPKAKEEDILKLQQELHDLHGQLAQKHLQHMLKVRKDLPEGFWGAMGPCPCMGCGCCGMRLGMGHGPMMGCGRGMCHGPRGCGPLMR